MSSDDMAKARRQVAAGRWQRFARCYVAQNGPLTELQRHWVAVLNAGAEAALAGRSGAAAAGLKGWGDGLIYVLVRRGASTPPALPGVKVHWTRGEIRRHPVGSPPRVRPAPALLQASSWMRSDRAAMGVLAAGVQQRIVRPDDLGEAVGGVSSCGAGGWLSRPSMILPVAAMPSANSMRFACVARPACRHRRARRSVMTAGAVVATSTWTGTRRGSALRSTPAEQEVRRWCDDLLRQTELVIAPRQRRHAQISAYRLTLDPTRRAGGVVQATV